MKGEIKKKEKWYYSYPILFFTLIGCLFPVSLILTILRFKGIKNQSGGYRTRSKIALGIHIVLIILLVCGLWGGYQDTKWVKQYDQHIQSGEYTAAKNLLDVHASSMMTETMVNRYLDLFEKSGSFLELDSVIEQYFEDLEEKLDFSKKIENRIGSLQDELSEAQKEKIAVILKEVEEERKIKELEAQAEVSRQAAEREALEESKNREEESKEKAEKEAEKQQKQEKESKEAARKAQSIESEKEAALKASEQAAKEISERVRQAEIKEAEARLRIDEYITDYLLNPDKKITKKLSKENEDIVKSILKQRMYAYLDEIDSWSSIDAENIQNYCDLYQKLYSAEDIQNILGSLEKLEGLDGQRRKIDCFQIGERSFGLESAIEGLQCGEWYIARRLETRYEDTITGAIQKEVDSYKQSDKSKWLAYNVEYVWGEAVPGDIEVVLYAKEQNPFSESGAYSINYIVSSDQTDLIDSKGFVYNVPVCYLVDDIDKLYGDFNRLQDVNGCIELEIDEMKKILTIN